MIETKISQETKTKAVLKGFSHKDQEEIVYMICNLATGEDEDERITLDITQGLLAQWLRENYKIHLHLCYFTETNKWNVDIYKFEKENGLLNDPMQYSNNNSYEEAMEEGLKAALDFI